MRVSSIQLEIQDRPKEETVAHVLGLLDQAAGSDLILLPELWPGGYFSFTRYREESEPIDGPLVRALSQKAKELEAYLFAGSFVEREGERLFNTGLFFDSQGRLAARYRKMHLFGYQSDEKRLLCRGEEAVVVATPWGKAGLAICYDLRFPELFRKMADQGAELFLICAAWPAARVEPWVLLCRARALENQALLFSCNCAGVNRGVLLGGHSLCVDPFGKVIGEAGGSEAILTCEVAADAVRSVRNEFPALRDRVLK